MNIKILSTVLFLGIIRGNGEVVSIGQIASNVRAIPIAELDRSDLPSGIEGRVIEQLRSDRAVHQLYRLNDQPTIDQLVDVVRRAGMDWMVEEGAVRNYMPGSLPRCSSPYILDDLAPLLYESSRLMKEPLDQAKHPRLEPFEYQNFVAELMAGVASTVPEFSEEVRASAKGYERGCAEAVIAWYEANREALLAERFADVGPFPDYDTFPHSWKPKVVSATEPPPASESAPAPPPQAPPAAPAPLPEAPPPPARPGRLPWLLGAAVVLTLAGFLRLRKRRRERKA